MDSLWFEYHLPTIWALLLSTAVMLYVILDGFDLGMGVLFPWVKGEHERDQMMNSVAPFWDGNETWLILGGGGLWIAFPKAYAIIMPALYLPVIFMLMGLIFRGISFEFRFVSKPNNKRWDFAFSAGSIAAAFFQGVILGTVVHGIKVVDGQFAGGPLDWTHPFALMCGVGVVAGYALLGTFWLMMRVEGELRLRAKQLALPALIVLFAFIIGVAIWTPLAVPSVSARWFDSAAMKYIWILPLLILTMGWWAWHAIKRGSGGQGFAAAVIIFLLCFVGLAVSIFPYLVPPVLTLWEASVSPESQLFMLLGAAPLIPLILAYTAFIYWTFRGKVKLGDKYY